MLPLMTCSRLLRGLNLGSRELYKQWSYRTVEISFSTSSTQLDYHKYLRPLYLSNPIHKRLQREFKVPSNFYVIYQEPKLHADFIWWLRASELFIYALPFLVPIDMYLRHLTVWHYISQENFWLGVAIVCLYTYGVNFVTKSCAKVLFYDSEKNIYRVYLYKQFKLTHKFIEFKAGDLRVANISPKVPGARNVFKIGKQFVILHDDLFVNKEYQLQLTANAVQEWLERYKQK